MAAHLWSIAHAHGAKRASTESETVGYAVGLLTWALSGGVFVAGKAAVAEMPPWIFVFSRVLIAALFLAFIVWNYRQAMLAFLRKRGLSAFLIGAIGLGITQGLLYVGLFYTSAVNAGIVFAVGPILTLVLAHILLREDMHGWQMVGSLVAFAGIIVIAVRGSLAVLLRLDLSIDDLFVFAAAVTFAVYTVMLRRAKFELDRLPLLVVFLFSATIATLPFALFELWNGEHVNLSLTGYLALAYAAIPGGALMYLFFNWSVDILGASRAGGMAYSGMVFTAILAWLVLGEAIEPYHVAGASLIIVGVVLVTFLKPRQVSAPAR